MRPRAGPSIEGEASRRSTTRSRRGERGPATTFTIDDNLSGFVCQRAHFAYFSLKYATDYSVGTIYHPFVLLRRLTNIYKNGFV